MRMLLIKGGGIVMKRCRNFVLLVLFFLNGWVIAQTAGQVLDNFKAGYKKSKNFTADFVETTIHGTNKGTSNGHLSFSKPNLLRQNYFDQENPNKIVQTIVLDGEFSWSYTPLLNQVNKMTWSNPNRKELLPGIGFSLENLEANYNHRLKGDKLAKERGFYRLELTPKPHLLAQHGNQANIHEKIELLIDSKNWLPVQFGYYSTNTNNNNISATITLKNIQRNLPLSADLFKFTIPKGAEVIDISPE